MDEFDAQRFERRADQGTPIHQQAGEELLDGEHLHLAAGQVAFNLDEEGVALLVDAGGDDTARAVLVAHADVERVAQGPAQRQHMAQQAKGTEHVLVSDPQPQSPLRQGLEGTLDHAHGLAVGDALGRVLQVFDGEAQAPAQPRGIDTMAFDHLGQRLQQEGGYLGEFVARIGGIVVHGRNPEPVSASFLFWRWIATWDERPII
ncbi:hypothetical protein BN889_05906 [Pseudomonas aeruginosa PA38182]|nr:hypothetical protein BN889_05906 [Pseudomonas aeruginosa PA38182]